MLSGMRSALIPVLAAAAVPLLHAQTVVPRVDAAVEVRIVEVDVVVTDRRGEPVCGLKAEDFVIIDGSKEQRITNFAERTEAGSQACGEAAAGIRPLQIVIFFDSLTTSTLSRQKAVESLTPLIDSLRPDDELMVVSWNGSLSVAVPPTSDRESIREGLRKIPLEVARGVAMTGGGKVSGFFNEPSSAFDRMLDIRAASEAVETTKAIRSVVSRMSGGQGRKILFLISDGLNLETALSRRTGESDLPQDMSQPGTRVTRDSLPSYDASAIVDQVTEAANAASVTLYTMQPSGLVTPGSAEDLDFVPDSSSIAGYEPATADEPLRHGRGTLIRLAERTGGRFVTLTNDRTAGVRRIVKELGNYYSIAYQPAEAPSTKSRRLSIRSRNPEHVVRAKRSMSDLSPDIQIAEKIVSNAIFPISHNDLNIRLIAGSAKRVTRDRMTAPLDVVVPYSNLSFLAEGNRYVANISVYLASVDQRQNVSEVRRFDRTIAIPRERYSKIAAGEYVYGIDLSLESIGKSSQVTVGVVDQISKVDGFARVEVTATPLRRR